MSVDHLAPTRLAGRYLLRELIASGGMGEVHLATDERLGRQVAVKVLARPLTDSAESVERFRREALAAAGLTHPNVARVYDYGVEGDRHFIVMEYLAGQSLHRVIRERSALGPEQAVGIAAQVCAALAAAHRAGIVHRDVKPGNIIVAPDGVVKVTDFGIAKALGASPLTDTGTVLGTAAYLPPEVGRGASAGPASDLYSLGIVLYEMLTGEVPYAGEGPVQVAMRHVSEDVPPPSARVPGLPAFLDAVVVRATRRDPGERYPSAEAMAAALQAGDTQPLPTLPEQTQAMTAPVMATQALRPEVVAAASESTTRPLPLATPSLAREDDADDREPRPHDRQHDSDHREHARPNRLRWALAGLAALLLVGLGALGTSLLSGDSSRQTATPPVTTPSSTAAPTTTSPSPTAKGPAGVVPGGLVGSDLAVAEQAITSAGLRYQWRMVASDAPGNQVIEASPAAGETLQPGDSVQLVVSRGKGGDANGPNSSDQGKGKGKGH